MRKHVDLLAFARHVLVFQRAPTDLKLKESKAFSPPNANRAKHIERALALEIS